MAATSSEQRVASHAASHIDMPQAASTTQESRGDVPVPLYLKDFAQAFAKALARQSIVTLNTAMHNLVVEAVINMCSAPLGHVLLSFVPVTTNSFESASLFTTCIVAAAWAEVVFFITFFRRFALFIVAMFRAQCYTDLFYMLFEAYYTQREYAWSRRFVVIRAALDALLKAFGLALFCLACRTLEGDETTQAVLTPGQAFLSMVVGKITIDLIRHWLVLQGGLAPNLGQEGSNMDTKDSGYASRAAPVGDDWTI